MATSKLQQLSEQQWHHISTADVAAYLNTDLSTGLSSVEVPQRHEVYGFNELKGKAAKSLVIRFLMEFNQPLIYILLAAGIVTLLLKDWLDQWRSVR